MKFIDKINSHHYQVDFSQIMRMLGRLGSAYDIKIDTEIMPDSYEQQIKSIVIDDNKKITLTVLLKSLSGNFGVLPDYINDEIMKNAIDDNFSLKDFIEVFNRIIYKLIYQVDLNRWLLIKNSNEEFKGFINAISSVFSDDKMKKYSFITNQGGTGNLELINNVINDVFDYQIKIEPRHIKRCLLPKDTLARLGNNVSYNSQLGSGFILGKACSVFFSELNVMIKAKSISEFNELKRNTKIAQEVMSCINFFLQRSFSIFIYVLVKRAYLSPPKLSSNKNVALKLGEVDYFPVRDNKMKDVTILLLSG